MSGRVLLYGATGSTNIGVIARSVLDGSAVAPLLQFGVALLAIGFGFKVAAVPFHTWVPDVYQGSPTAVTVP